MDKIEAGDKFIHNETQQLCVVVNTGSMKVENGTWFDSVSYRNLDGFDNDRIFTRDATAFGEKFRKHGAPPVTLKVKEVVAALLLLNQESTMESGTSAERIMQITKEAEVTGTTVAIAEEIKPVQETVVENVELPRTPDTRSDEEKRLNP